MLISLNIFTRYYFRKIQTKISPFFSHNYLPWKGGDIQLNNIHNCKTKKAPKLCENVFKECTVFQIYKNCPISNVTAGNFLDLSVFKVLLELNFGKCRSPKTAFFATFGALNFVNLVNFSLKKC